jgi:diaminohydroxyphosphoribosylaminopyrimidine deaminase/5-amino-6-(5-phosphoribosylamino)uracil reductase
MDAIVVGVVTVLADDPQLTARPPGPRTPVRVVLDRRGRTPATSQVARTARETPTWIVTTGESAPQLGILGCEVVNLPDVAALLDEMGRRRMTNILVEGGAAVLGSFLDAGEIDEVHVFIAPRLVGGVNARTPIGGGGADKIADALALADWQVEMIEGDVYLHGWR